MEKARRSPGVRLATLLAACLTFGTAFGLHPEPGSALRGAPAAAVAQRSAQSVDSSPHDCLACRAHRPLVSVAFLPVVSAPRRSATRLAASRPSLLAAFDPGCPDGRGPPRLS